MVIILSEALVVAVRGLIGFFTLLIFARLLGKQQVSQLTFFEYILGITIGSIASSLTVDLTSRAWPHWIGLVTWTAACFVLQWISIKSRYASKYINGEPVIVVMNGRIMEDAMNKIRYTTTDLLEQLRGKDVFDLSEVQFAVLETNGSLSVLKKAPYQNVTLKDLGISSKTGSIAVELICEGKVIEQNLKQIDKDLSWLEKQLNSRGIVKASEVFYAEYDPSNENLYIDTYKDSLKNIVNISDYPGPY